MQTVGLLRLRNSCSIGLILAAVCVIFLFSKSNAFGSQTSAITMEVFNSFKRFLAGVMPWSRSTEDDQPKYQFPETIEEFGYVFNDQGQLVSKVDMTGRFVFNVKEDDRQYNQQHYDALGEAITEYLYEMMEKSLNLQKVYLPVDEKKEPLSFIFQSPDALTADKLMVLIHGSGVVRAGQWSRKLIINENIDEGSQFPYIRRAMADGYGVIVMNTNLNKAVVNNKLTDIRENNTPEKHGLYVWNHIVRRAAAKSIVVVAHSYGGIVLCNILEKYLQDFQERVFCVVFTDSVHSADRSLWSKPAKEFLKERAVNFASTYVPINFIMQSSSPDDVMSVSAGTKEHERTSSACIESAFKFIRDNYETWSKDRTMAPRTDFKPLPDDLSMYSPAKEWEKRTDEAVARQREQEELRRKSAEQPMTPAEQNTLTDQGCEPPHDDDSHQRQTQQPVPDQNVEQRATDQKNKEVEFAEEAMEANLENERELGGDGKGLEARQSVEFTTCSPVQQEVVQEKSEAAVQEKADVEQETLDESMQPVDVSNDAESKEATAEKISENEDVVYSKAEEPFRCTEYADGDKAIAKQLNTPKADGDKSDSENGKKANTPDGNTARTEGSCTDDLAGKMSLEETSAGEEICSVQGSSDRMCASPNVEATQHYAKNAEEEEAEREDINSATVMTVESGDEH